PQPSSTTAAPGGSRASSSRAAATARSVKPAEWIAARSSPQAAATRGSLRGPRGAQSFHQPRTIPTSRLSLFCAPLPRTWPLAAAARPPRSPPRARRPARERAPPGGRDPPPAPLHQLQPLVLEPQPGAAADDDVDLLLLGVLVPERGPEVGRHLVVAEAGPL